MTFDIEYFMIFAFKCKDIRTQKVAIRFFTEKKMFFYIYISRKKFYDNHYFMHF